MLMQKIIRGRVIQLENTSLSIQNEQGCFKIPISSREALSIGDIVEVKNNFSLGIVNVLTPNSTSQKTTHWMKRILDPRRLHATQIRYQVETAIRDFFHSKGFHETRTPLIVPCPGMETHIRPFMVKSSAHPESLSYLPTSPEFAMKRLLVGGLEKIFQLAPAFRDEPLSHTHNPEFTLLEWYRAYANYEDIMHDTENLFEFLAIRIFGKPAFTFQGKEIQVKTPWPRLRVRDLFQEKAGIDLVQRSDVNSLAAECKRLNLPVNEQDTWDDLYFKIWLNCIEPQLPPHQAVFVTRYPVSQAALAKIDSDSDGSRWARRFELYAGGIELGNAFDELTDPTEQRNRFIEDMNLREKIYGTSFPKNPLDAEFLGALTEGMPPSGGIAIGVDRMVMLLADEPEISYTQWL